MPEGAVPWLRPTRIPAAPIFRGRFAASSKRLGTSPRDSETHRRPRTTKSVTLSRAPSRNGTEPMTRAVPRRRSNQRTMALCPTRQRRRAGKEDHVGRKDRKELERKEAWIATKTAVGAYAKNPCRATEVKVTAALRKIRRLETASKMTPARPREQEQAEK